MRSTPIGSGFTYQGRLRDGGVPVNYPCDFQFSLFDAGDDGIQIGDITTLTNIEVNDGYFTVTLDFGDAAFNGDERWLLIAVRPTGVGDYTTLSPRQELLATPYALYAMAASWSGLSGMPPGLDLNAADDLTIASTFAGDVAGDYNHLTLAPNSVSSEKIINGSIINEDLATGAFPNITGVGTLSSLAVANPTTFNNVTYLWPSSSGHNGDVLTTNSSGELNWTTMNGSGINQLVHTFIVNPNQSIAQGDVVTFQGGVVQKGFWHGNGITCGPECKWENSSSITGLGIAPLSPVAFLLFSHDSSSPGARKCKIEDNTVSFGEFYDCPMNLTNVIVTSLAPQEFLLTNYNTPGSSSVVCDVSSQGLTFRAQGTISNGSAQYVSIAPLADWKVVATYQDASDANNGKAVIGTISSAGIVYASKFLFNPSCGRYSSVAALGIDKFLVAYQDTDNAGKVIIGNVSGVDISFGFEGTFSSTPAVNIAVKALSATQVLIAYQGGASNYGSALIATVDGNNVSFGPVYIFNSNSTSGITIALFSPFRSVISYISGPNNSGNAIIAEVSGNTINFGIASNLNVGTGVLTHAVINGNQFVAAYKDVTDNNRGKVIVGDINPSDCNVVGIAKESGSGGQNIRVIIDGISDVHSNLAPGIVYYGSEYGDVTATPSLTRLGLAVSSTEIQLNSAMENYRQFFGRFSRADQELNELQNRLVEKNAQLQEHEELLRSLKDEADANNARFNRQEEQLQELHAQLAVLQEAMKNIKPDAAAVNSVGTGR